MAGSLFAANFELKPFFAALGDIDRVGRRAAQWSVRECGRQTARAAKRYAPVKTGAYKKGIRSSRKFDRPNGNAYGLKVGPRGDRVHLYAGKVEAKLSPMAKAYAEVAPKAKSIHEAAMAKALARYL
jgi:hypothetical protein